MIQPKIQEVYAYNGVHTIRQKGFFFSPSEFEQFKREFGKELLEKAAEEFTEECICHKIPCNCCTKSKMIRKTITSVLDDYLLNNKI